MTKNPTDKHVDELVDILMSTEEDLTPLYNEMVILGMLGADTTKNVVKTKGPDQKKVAEELAQWIYEHLQANGLESTTSIVFAWHSKDIEKYWVEAKLEFGKQIYTITTLTNDDRPWALVVRNKWATHIGGSWTDLEIENAQKELNPCTTIESITKKLIEIRKRINENEK